MSLIAPAKPAVILSRRRLITGAAALAAAAALPRDGRAVQSSRWPLGGAQIIGNVGGTANVWQPADQILTRPANTTAYASGGALGSSSSVIFSFGDIANYPTAQGFFRQPNSSGLLSGLRLGCSLAGITASNVGSVTGHLFQASPSAAAGLVDQSQFPTLQADSPVKLGIVQFSTWYIGGTGSDLIESYGAPVLSQQPIIAAPGSQALFVVCVANSAFTPASAAIWHLHASSQGD